MSLDGINITEGVITTRSNRMKFTLGKKNIYFICFGVTYKKIFFEITN